MEMVMDRLKKIEALAKAGRDGERENAQRLLEKLCEQHGGTLEQLADEDKRMQWFPVRGKREQELFRLVLVHVCQTRQIRHRRTAEGYECELTLVQGVDVRECWRHYRAAWKQQMDDMFSAFVHKNRIYGPPSETEGPELDEEQWAAVQRVLGLMRGMEARRWDKRAKLEGRAA